MNCYKLLLLLGHEASVHSYKSTINSHEPTTKCCAPLCITMNTITRAVGGVHSERERERERERIVSHHSEVC